MQMKDLSAFGRTVWNGTIVLLLATSRIVFAGGVAYGVYLVVQQFGFSKESGSRIGVNRLVVLLAGILMGSRATTSPSSRQ